MFLKLDLSKEDRGNLITLLALGLVLRLYAFSQIYMITLDGALQYIPVADLFYHGEYLEALLQPQLPLYPFLISIVTHITGNLELSGQLISIIFSLAAVFPLYLIGKSLFGSRPAFWTSILYLINPLMLQCSVDVLKEGLQIFLFFSAVYCSLRFLQEGKGHWLFWTVAFVAGEALVRMLALAVLAVLGLWLGYGALSRRLRDREHVYRYLWVLLAIIGIVLILVLAGIAGREFFVVKKPYVRIAKALHRWFVYYWHNLPHVGAHALYIVDRFIEKTYYIPLPLAGLGLWWKMKAKEVSSDGMYLALLMGVLIAIFFPFLYASGRYLLPAVFLLYLWAGFGFVEMQELIAKRFTRYPGLAAVIPVMIIVGAMLSFSLQPQRLDKIGRKEVGLWLQEHTLTPPLILADDPRIAYYAGGNYVRMPPKATPEKVVKKGRREKVDYLVVEEKETGDSASFAPFEKKGELELVLRHPYGQEGKTIYVYKVREMKHLPGIL